MLHLIKLSVGTESVESLRRWQAMRRKQVGRVFHRTRMTPRRGAELLDGGSVYWVIKGVVRARQRLIGLEPTVDENGRRCVLLLLDPTLVPTVPHAHRAFQGWRYLSPEDAPPDLERIGADGETMPEEMAAALRELGLL
ncbi:MAG: DUF1489 family protein [Kiloniellaceae bacterium]